MDKENNKGIKQFIDSTVEGVLTKQHCDITTGKIYGCKKGSKEWWHELGHIKFQELQSTSVLIMWQGVAHLLWMFSLTLSIFNRYMMWIAIPMLIIYIFVDIYEEYWANRYAKEHYKG